MSSLTHWLWREAQFYVTEMRAKFDTFHGFGKLYQSYNFSALFTGDVSVHKTDQSPCLCGASSIKKRKTNNNPNNPILERGKCDTKKEQIRAQEMTGEQLQF